ncbi:MAG TPA: hypothetical protein VK921_16925 [Anditalea sp.]|nr:hypothetical protein [Anditalea sp.]
MNKYRYIQGALLALTMLVVSCTDFVDPNVPYKDFNTGAYLRTIARTSTTFNFFNLDESKFALTIEAVDIEDGATVETVEVRVRRRRLIPGVGLAYVPAQVSSEWTDVLVRTLSRADFAPNSDSRFLRASFEVTANQTMEVLGLTADDIQGGDTFEFRLVLNDRLGRVFTNNNRSSDVAGGVFYDSPFQYNVNVVCPSDLGGTFAFTTTNISAGAGGNAAACGAEISGNITITAVAGVPGQYTVNDVSFGMFACAWDDSPPAGSVRLVDSCSILRFTGTDKYGDSYTIVITGNTGTTLTFNWSNSYGDGGTTVLTAPSGFTFPSDLRTS